MSNKPLRILLAHNFYGSTAPSGEDSVFRNERDLLVSKGFDVIPFERFNDDIDQSTLGKRLRLGLSTAWAHDTYRAISRVIEREQPDIAHFHNTFPQISPSAYQACQKYKVPVVQTIHNFRMICPGALLLREGRPCEDCVGNNLLPALRHKCYRNSLAATGSLVTMLAYNRIRGSYRRNVDAYIALTNFAASRLAAGGLPSDKMVVKPNFLPHPPEAGDGSGGYAVYVGRLASEKGVRTLLQAWKKLPSIPLKLLGGGPLSSELADIIRNEGLDVELLGFQPHEKILDIVRDAMFQIVPSEWYEGFPMVILEAFACGTPVIASRIGSLEEIITDNVTGKLFNPGDPDDLASTVKSFVEKPDILPALRKSVRETFDKHFTAEANMEQLEEIYNNLISPNT